MGKLPGFMFYPGDWMKDPGLRRCSLAAKGLWIEMLCLMFESDERGYLISAGVAWSEKDIAQAVGRDFAGVHAGLVELGRSGVCSRDTRGAYFCRRLIRDDRIRQARAAAGRIGGKAGRKHPVSKTQANLKQIPEDESEREEEPKKRRKRKPDPLWETVCAVFGLKPVTRAEQTRVGGIVRDLRLKQATPNQIRGSPGCWSRRYPNTHFTPEAMLKHWDDLQRAGPVGGGDVQPSVWAAKKKWAKLDDAEKHRLVTAALAKAPHLASSLKDAADPMDTSLGDVIAMEME